MKQWFVVIDDRVELGCRNAGFLQTIIDGVLGKAPVVLDAAKALLLGGGDDPSVADQRSGAVMVVRRNAEDVSDHCKPAISEAGECSVYIIRIIRVLDLHEKSLDASIDLDELADGHDLKPLGRQAVQD